MRLWSLHPCYLDVKGLVALWREGLLAQAVLAGQTRGYKHHPQLARFLDTPAPRKYIAAYLRVVCDEAARRGYNFDANKIGRAGKCQPIPVTTGQLKYEWEHLQGKLTRRDPDWLAGLGNLKAPELHPLFHKVAGKIADWERIGD
jgi:hypothetical protein